MALDDGHVNADYLKQAAVRIRTLKELTYQRMEIREGDRVLDAGCGPGVDTAPLAQRVGSTGRVIALDSDSAMLEEARNLAQQAGVADRIDHRLGSALAIPLESDTIDACRAERLLQVLPPGDEHGVIKELLRVTRPGGRIVLADTDWCSASVDCSDTALERRLMNFFAMQMRPNGFAGRRLYPLCREFGLNEITVESFALLHHRFDETPFGNWLIDTASKVSFITEREATAWHNEMSKRDAEGRFVASVNMVVVLGRKPV